MSNVERSPVVFQGLRKAVAAGKKKKALAASKLTPWALWHSSVWAELGVRLWPPATHCSSLWAKGKLMSFPTQAACLSLPANTLHLGICSLTGLRPRAPRVNYLLRAAGNSDQLRVSWLWSLDGSKGMSSHTSLSGNRCVHLLVKNLGRQMPGDVVREESWRLGICI